MSRVVYVGHVPFDLTEEQIEDIFKSAGPVQQTRLVFDRATGKSKGFAFVQYFEPESAASAVRNLNNYKVGNMNLKVNYSSGKFPGNTSNSGGKDQQVEDDETGVVPEIVNIVSSIPPPKKIELLQDFKKMIEQRKDDTAKLLESNPQFAYAIVQSMFEMGMIDGPSAASLITQTPVNQTGPSRQQKTTSSRQRGPPKQQLEQMQLQQMQLQQTHPSQMHPPQMIQPQHQQSMPQSQTPSSEQVQMFRQVMALSSEQLNSMPAEQRQAAMGIRAQIESGQIVLQ